MKFTETQVHGFEAALRGMRNPMNSHHLSDSYKDANGTFVIGEADMGLCRRLIVAGPEHAKFLRQIHVWVDADMPRYWWQEADTYKFGSKNSASTMHKLLNNKNEISMDSFVICGEDTDVMTIIVNRLESLRRIYQASKSSEQKNRLLLRAKRILPESLLQIRTWDTNYAELRNIYHQRKTHRLKEEWKDTFCTWIETLPYAKELIID